MQGRDSLVALLTDFGSRDPYVAAVKGVLASRTNAAILDLSHDIGNFDTFEAAVFLNAVAGYFPRSTASRAVVFVVVVDPGVGTSRRLLAAREDGRIFLAPDNGVLDLVSTTATEYWSIERTDLFLADSSNTFHGRDRLAPVAAAVANGLAIEALGPRLPPDAIHRLDYEHPHYGDDRAIGTVIALDHYGNAITDLDVTKIDAIDGWELHAGEHRVVRVSETYAGAPAGEPFMIVGSRGTIEVSVANASAADLLRLNRRDRIEIRRRSEHAT